MVVRDIAITDVESATAETPVVELAETMAAEGVGSVVILEEFRPVGIVTDRDLTVRVLAMAADPDATTAGDVMTPDPATVNGGDSLLAVSDALCAAGVRRMPVVDDGGRIVGIVTLDDLMGRLARELENLAGVVEHVTTAQ